MVRGGAAGEEKTEMKSHQVLHMLIIYLGGFTDSTRESDTRWRNNRGGMYN